MKVFTMVSKDLNLFVSPSLYLSLSVYIYIYIWSADNIMPPRYSVAMMLPYELISLRGIWHIMLAWHHFMMMSSAQEAITEGCCSHLRFLERRNVVGRDVSLGRLSAATSLRASGLRGDLLDLPVLYKALEQHFQGGPETFHFQRSSGLPWKPLLR